MQFISLGKKRVIPIKLTVQNKNAISLLDSALNCWPYNGAKQCDNVLARYFITVIMSPKITQGCASAVCLYPISHGFICWLQGPRIKEHIWRCTSCGRPRIPPVTQTALQLLWAVAHAGTGANPTARVSPRSSHCPAGLGPPQSITALRKLRRITDKLMKQL